MCILYSDKNDEFDLKGVKWKLGEYIIRSVSMGRSRSLWQVGAELNSLHAESF